ncbi:MAG: hypothetical protein OEY49_09455 [Candidatus Heimdallarchaeota archaeon]|nr:hypothetical protein [Candidatus Heimdallarchaeota archaeon]
MTEYEFTKDENAVFEDLVKNLKIVSIVIGLAGLSVTLSWILLRPNITVLIDGIMLLFLGFAMYRPIDNFKNIITTSGKDISELMTALREISRDWLIVNIITFIGRMSIIPIIIGNL